MARKGYEKVSQREYARRLGISNEAVSKAIREKRIVKGWSKKEQKIIVEHADQEFGILFKKSVQELAGNGNHPQSDPGRLTLNGSSSYADARRVDAILQAQLKSLDLSQRKGELVNKEIVYKQLFTFGQNMRTSLLAVPDRTIDNILASKSRAEAYNLLTSALHEVLEQLTKTEQLNFQ